MTEKDKSDIPESSDVGISLIESIKSSELGNLMQDFGEVALDRVVKDGILRDIPVIGSIVGVAKAAISMRDTLLVKKLLYFLRELSDTTEEERKNFLQEFEEDLKEQRRVGENLILLLDRLDDLDKPVLVAKLLKAFIRGKISRYDEFVYYSSIVDRMPMMDLSALLSHFSTGDVDEEWLAQRFYYLGLSFMKVKVPAGPQLNKFETGLDYFSRQTNPANAKLRFKLSESAYLFSQILLEDKYDGSKFYSDPEDWD